MRPLIVALALVSVACGGTTQNSDTSAGIPPVDCSKAMPGSYCDGWVGDAGTPNQPCESDNVPGVLVQNNDGSTFCKTEQVTVLNPSHL